MADANNVLATAEPWAYVVMAYMGSLSTVDIVKSLQCLLVCQSFSAVTDKIGKQKKVFLLSKIYEDFQARVNEPGIYAKFIPASCSVATAEISRRLLCSRGVTALTAESLWAKKDEVCKQIGDPEATPKCHMSTVGRLAQVLPVAVHPDGKSALLGKWSVVHSSSPRNLNLKHRLLVR